MNYDRFNCYQKIAFPKPNGCSKYYIKIIDYHNMRFSIVLEPEGGGGGGGS